MAREIVDADRSEVRELLAQVTGRAEDAKLERMGGLTNRTYRVTYPDGMQYVVRIPGEGTEELIVRNDEKISTELACRVGIDAELLYFGSNGAKVTEYIPGAVTMSAELFADEKRMAQAAEIFRRLHNSGEDTGVPFEVFDMAAGYERIIHENPVSMYPDYEETKAVVMAIKKEIDAVCGIHKVPCHNDPLCENWVVSDSGRMYLIDWEYAGMNDPLWDVADLSIEAGFDAESDAKFLCAYLERKAEPADYRHFLAEKLYVDYLWTLWAKTRVPYDGQPMEDWASERYARLKKNIQAFKEI